MVNCPKIAKEPVTSRLFLSTLTNPGARKAKAGKDREARKVFRPKWPESSTSSVAWLKPRGCLDSLTNALSVAEFPPAPQCPVFHVDTTAPVNYRGFNTIEREKAPRQTVPFTVLSYEPSMEGST